MSGGLKMPGKGKAALLLSELNAEHAPRPEPPPPHDIEQESNKETNVTTLQRYNEGTNEPTVVVPQKHSNALIIEGSNEETNQRENAPTKVAATKRTKAMGESSEREGRLARALEIAAEDEIAVVTIRVSAKLNKYLDDYVERINRLDARRKYRKQDAIAEAFAGFYADHIMPPAPMDEEL
jgi:hypothetical protein